MRKLTNKEKAIKVFQWIKKDLSFSLEEKNQKSIDSSLENYLSAKKLLKEKKYTKLVYFYGICI